MVSRNVELWRTAIANDEVATMRWLLRDLLDAHGLCGRYDGLESSLAGTAHRHNAAEDLMAVLHDADGRRMADLLHQYRLGDDGMRSILVTLTVVRETARWKGLPVDEALLPEEFNGRIG